MIVFFILIALALCQSIFGMGLLVFGTPILLLIDYSYEQALWTLLPASFTVSSLQLLEISGLDREFRTKFLTWSIPALSVTLATYLIWHPSIKIELIMGLVMLMFVISRILSRAAGDWVSNFIKCNSTSAMFVMGAVHGISNMGGSVLSLISTSYYNEKSQIRDAVVYCYWFFGLCQLALLALFSFQEISMFGIAGSPIAAVVYLLLGKRSFEMVEQNAFKHLFTTFILICAALLLYQ